MGNRFITVNELQEMLKIGRVTVYELVNAPGFPSMRIGRKILVDKERVEEWISEQIEENEKYKTDSRYARYWREKGLCEED